MALLLCCFVALLLVVCGCGGCGLLLVACCGWLLVVVASVGADVCEYFMTQPSLKAGARVTDDQGTPKHPTTRTLKSRGKKKANYPSSEDLHFEDRKAADKLLFVHWTHNGQNPPF